MTPFNLLRYFTVTSLAVVAAVVAATGWAVASNLERILTEEAGLYAQDVARALNRALFAEAILSPSGLAAFDPADAAQRARLAEVVASTTRGLRVMTVILFDDSGTVVFSTNPAYVGHRSLDNPGLESALAGSAASLLKRAELERGPTEPGHDLVETYAPLRVLDPGSGRRGPIIGALEIYQDGRPITAEIAKGQRDIVLVTSGSVLLLFAALFVIVRRGHLRIEQLTRALEGTNRELEERVQERTHEIRQSERRLRALFDGIADGISVIDDEFRVAESNSGIRQLFGALEGSPPRCFERYARRTAPCPGCPAEETLRSGARRERRYRWPARGGSERDFEVTTFPFTKADERPAVIELVRDVSERSELERQLIQSESLASLGEMAAGVAHELRNPIGMIASSAQLVGSGELPERDRELIEVIQRESARVSETVTEFVKFAQPPAPSRTAVAPLALLERVRAMLSAEAEQRGIEMRLEIAPDLPQISVDVELLHRALANLVLNGLQIQGTGGGVALRARREASGEVALDVVDRGPGIPEGDLERIFQPFFSRRPGGTGLGLSIVQRIVSANDGHIAVYTGSEGTTFSLRFGGVTP